MNTKPQKRNPYGDQLIGVASFLFIGFAALVFGLGTLATHGHIDLSAARALVNAYWVASLLWFAVFIRKNFRRFYRSFIERLRLYTPDEIALRWYFGGFVLFFPFVFYVLLKRYDDAYVSAFDHSSMKPLLGAYACTLGATIYLYTVIVLVVAKLRGIACYKSFDDSVSKHKCDK